MKRFLCIFTSMMLLLTFLVTSTNAETILDSNKTYRIANLVKQIGSAWYQRQQLGLDKINEEYSNVEAFMVGPETADPALQVQMMEDLIAQKVDAIVVVPISVQTLEPVCKKAREAGIIVVAHEAAGMTNVDYDVEAFDNAEYGAYMMDNLAKAMGESGEYVTMVGYLTSKSHIEWMDAAFARQQEAYPNMTLVAEKIEDHDDTTTGHDKAVEIIKTYPNLKGILGGSMSGTQGVGLAIEEMGVSERVKATGTCIPSVSGIFLESGSLFATSAWDPAGAGYATNKVALLALTNGVIENGTDLGFTGYTSIKLVDNVVYGNDLITFTAENMAEYPF